MKRFLAPFAWIVFLAALSCLPLFSAQQKTPAPPKPPSKTPFLVEWGFDQFFPSLKIEVDDWDWTDTTEISLYGIRIYERKSDTILFSAKRLALSLGPTGIFSKHLESADLEEPSFFLSPAFFSAIESLAPTPEENQENQESPAVWSLGRLSCEFGELYVHHDGSDLLPPIYCRSHFSFDIKDLGTEENLLDLVHSLFVWDVSLSQNSDFSSPFICVDKVQSDFSTSGLLEKKQLSGMTISGGSAIIGSQIRALLSAGNPSEKKPLKQNTPSPPFSIKQLEVKNLHTTITEEIPGVGPGFEYTLNTSLHNIPLGGVSSALGSDLQRVELAGIEILSPHDPLVRVASIHSVFVYFTIEGILASKLSQVILLSPTLYISPDLFLYMQAMQEGTAPQSAATASGGGWNIEHLRIEFGRLVLGGERVGQIGLPMSFQTSASDVRFSDLASLRLETSLEIDPQSFSFPSLQLDLDSLRGNMRFAYPPGKHGDNLVNELHMDSVLWRQFKIGKLWLSTTFDKTGINAQLGGNAYDGYLTAGLSFSFGETPRWIGWITGTRVNLKKLTAVLAPQNLSLSGPADFRLEVDACGSSIDRVKGSLKSKAPGTLHIAKIDNLLQNLPPEWNSLKRSATKVALENLRDFHYTSASADFWTVGKQGKLSLRLPGKLGSRNIDLYLFDDESPDGKWKNLSAKPPSKPPAKNNHP